MNTRIVLILIMASLVLNQACSQPNQITFVEHQSITTGAQNLIGSHLNKLKNKKVGIVANQASLVNSVHIVDTLISSGVDIYKIFSPEHGFRGNAEAGASIQGGIDSETGLEIVSLYGNHRKPTKEDLMGIDVMLFDLQDVGVRFYTYISTLTYVMEACALNSIPVIILDRPNPNGFYVDGPVLDTAFSSFVGLHTVPIVYGMTIGEYGLMVNGENWLPNDLKSDLTIIPLKSYNRYSIFELPVKPSPNLPNWESVYLYPSLCLFEGSVVSIGRGTKYPFQIYGHPKLNIGSFSFTPESIPGVSENPKFKDIQCFGQNLSGYAANFKNNPNQINLNWLIGAHASLKSEGNFFIPYFENLSGNDTLREQIRSGMSENEIRKSWKKGLRKFMNIREKYLLYD